jgi:hypothetical protein
MRRDGDTHQWEKLQYVDIKVTDWKLSVTEDLKTANGKLLWKDYLVESGVNYEY